mmetsp:Transcript_7648/g.25916  ORF Transcript_7648/g.25916 Transcript_7648/m.25916 type:complete len:275 (+) Transcript_7648:94-918(+)
MSRGTSTTARMRLSFTRWRRAAASASWALWCGQHERQAKPPTSPKPPQSLSAASRGGVEVLDGGERCSPRCSSEGPSRRDTLMPYVELEGARSHEMRPQLGTLGTSSSSPTLARKVLIQPPWETTSTTGGSAAAKGTRHDRVKEAMRACTSAAVSAVSSSSCGGTPACAALRARASSGVVPLGSPSRRPKQYSRRRASRARSGWGAGSPRTTISAVAEARRRSLEKTCVKAGADAERRRAVRAAWSSPCSLRLVSRCPWTSRSLFEDVWPWRRM